MPTLITTDPLVIKVIYPFVVADLFSKSIFGDVLPEIASILIHVSNEKSEDIPSSVALSVTEKLSLKPGPEVDPPSRSKYPPLAAVYVGLETSDASLLFPD